MTWSTFDPNEDDDLMDVTDDIDRIMEALVPRMSNEDIIELLKRRLTEANNLYHDFLSRPQA